MIANKGMHCNGLVMASFIHGVALIIAYYILICFSVVKVVLKF